MPCLSDIRVAHDPDKWAKAAVPLIHEVGEQAVQDHGGFLLALSGGSTPERLYQTLSSSMYADRYDWSQTGFFFSDERCVPPGHPDSNFGLADRTLFRPLKIRDDQIHRMAGEAPDADQAARDYERGLRIAAAASSAHRPPMDLILLGLGHDGHTASLFPGTGAVHEFQRWVTVGHAPSQPSMRLTLTLGVINRASVVVFLVTGAAKAEIVKRVLEPSNDVDRQLPAALVKPDRGRLIWLLDHDAAMNLSAR